MNEIFVYGTLGDPEYQLALYDRTLPTRPATLADWSVVVAESGYLTIVEEPGMFHVYPIVMPWAGRASCRGPIGRHAADP